MRILALLAGAAVMHGALGATACAQQRRPTSTPTPTPAPEARDDRERTIIRWDDESDRAVLGINTGSSSSERDTLGVLVSSITSGGPAEKAGLEEGNRIAAINGVNLRLAPADAGEDDMNGIASRRLTREMRKVKPGDEVSLRVYANGAFRDVRVKTIAADELTPRRTRLTRAERREEMGNRAVLGLNLGATGSRRDTLGPMVVRVESDGPAEKAGVVEGDRVQAVNGVDLRVARDDAGDDFVANARLNRFRRALRDLKPGDRVELRVYSGGQTRTVQVTAARARDLYKDGDRRTFFFGEGGDGLFAPGPMGAAIAPVPPMPPMAPMPPSPPRLRIAPRGHGLELEHDMDFDDEHFDFSFDVDVDVEGLHDMGRELRRALDGSRVEIRRALEDAREGLEDAREGWEEARERAYEDTKRAKAEGKAAAKRARPLRSASAATLMDPEGVASDMALAAGDIAAASYEPVLMSLDGEGEGGGVRWGYGWDDDAERVDEGDEEGGAVMTANGHGDRYTLRLPGLRLAKVTPDLAATLGAGSERGLLVLDASARWGALRAGDVLLAVNGTPVRDGDRASVRFDRSVESRVTVLRKGARVELTIPRN